jgi:hypothetical protein
MAYVQESDLLGDISQEFLTQALQDTCNGSQNATTWAQLAASVGIDIDAYIGLRYALPLVPNAQLYPNTYGYPPVICSAAKTFSLEKLYKRRGIGDDKNPWAGQASQTRTLLKAISLGQSPLAPELNRKDPTASIVTQPMRTMSRGSVLNA